MDYALLRKTMVQEQLVSRGIKDQRVLEAFSKVERHKFIPSDLRDSAYADFPVPIGQGQTISQPYIVALMAECLNLTGREKILEIGTGSGYQTAILAELADQVCSIERFEVLAKNAQAVLNELGYKNIKLKVGDGTLGWQELAPFGRIMISAATAQVPLPLIEQLGDSGKLILPLGDSLSQVLTILEKKSGKIESRQVCGCVFVPLIGKFAYPREED